MIIVVMFGILVALVVVYAVMNVVVRRRFLSEAESAELTEEELEEVTGAGGRLELKSSGFGRGTLWRLTRRSGSEPPPEP